MSIEYSKDSGSGTCSTECLLGWVFVAGTSLIRGPYLTDDIRAKSLQLGEMGVYVYTDGDFDPVQGTASFMRSGTGCRNVCDASEHTKIVPIALSCWSRTSPNQIY